MAKQFITFKVRGPKGAVFPLDMLRFGQCWPTSSSDVVNIENSMDPSIRVDMPNRWVSLTTYCEPVALMATLRRFESFNCIFEETDELMDMGIECGQHSR